MIPVGPLPQRLVHEQVARHAPHRLEHPLVGDPAPDELLLDHPLALALVALACSRRCRAVFFSTAFRPPSQSLMRPRAPW